MIAFLIRQLPGRTDCRTNDRVARPAAGSVQAAVTNGFRLHRIFDWPAPIHKAQLLGYIKATGG